LVTPHAGLSGAELFIDRYMPKSRAGVSTTEAGMASLSFIKHTAQQMSTSSSGDVAKLSSLLMQLCAKVEEIEKTAKTAKDEALKAKRDARK
jgi:outer membrane murein-binding lipoprotein Lpp